MLASQMKLTKENANLFYKDMAQMTAKDINTSIQREFQMRVGNIKQLWLRYQTVLQSNAESFVQSWLQASKMGHLSGGLSALQKKNMQSKAARFLNELHKWTIESYTQILQFRAFLTGQEFHYYVLSQTKTANRSFVFTEEQFLQLLSNNVSIWGKGELDQMSGSNINAESFVNKLRIEVNTGIRYIEKQFGKANISFSNLNKDALYQYLSEDPYHKLRDIHAKYNVFADDEGTKTQVLFPNRRYELYAQLLHSFEWKKSKNNEVVYPANKPGKYFFTQDREDKVESFYDKYIEAKMHEDKIAFYKTGDSIIDACNLIEAKTKGGAIRITTVRNAIRDLAKINYSSASDTSEKLIELFSYYDIGNVFAQEIQYASALEAERHIKEVLKKVSF